MKTSSLLLLLPLCLTLLRAAPAADEAARTLWDFNAVPDTPEGIQSPAPAVGAGLASLAGGVTATLAAGVPSGSGGRAWNTSRFPSQGLSNVTAGVRFAVGTAGQDRIQLRFQHRFSAGSSGRAVVRVSVNGVDFLPIATYAAPGADLWTNIVVPLDALPEAADNAALAFEVISVFAADTNRYAAAGPGSTYSSTGTWRLDDVEVSGERMPDPPTAPRIRVAPAGREFSIGDPLRLGVGVSGAEPLEFQWQFDGEDLPGETGPILQRDAVTAGRYRVRVANAFGEIASADAVISVKPPPPAFGERTCRELHERVVAPDFLWLDGNRLVAVEGIVVTHANLGTPDNARFHLQDATGGIVVNWRGAGAESLPPAGARVRVVGPVVQVAGLLELAPWTADPLHSVTVLEEGLPLPEPVELEMDAGWLSDPVRMESLEGRRVRVSGVTMSTSTPLFANRGANLTLTSAETGATVVLRVEGDTLGAWVDLAGQPKPAGPFSVIGVWSQGDTTRPHTGGYRLVPTRYTDLVLDGRPPDVKWTVVLSNVLRQGDALTNAFAEQSLRPGESLQWTAVFSDSAGGLHPGPGAILPNGATVAWTDGPESDDGIARLTAEVLFTATEAHAGKPHRILLPVIGASATRRAVWTVYVPTPAERQVLLTEIHASPVIRPDAPGFNPLQRDDWPPASNDVLASRIASWDEFVELVNLGTAPVDLGNWTLSDASRVQAWIPPADERVRIPSGGTLVLYGGPPGSHAPRLDGPALSAELAGGASAGTDGLGLNNTGDTLLLRNAEGNLVERIVYTSRQVTAGVSLVRWPVPDGPWVTGTAVNPERMASPGSPPIGTVWPGADPPDPLAVRVRIEADQVRLDWTPIPGSTYSVRSMLPQSAGWSLLAQGLPAPWWILPLGTENARWFQVTSP